MERTVAKIKSNDYKKSAETIDRVRAAILQKQQKLNELRRQYADVIALQNLQHKTEANAARIAKQEAEITKLKDDVARGKQNPTPAPHPQEQQNQQQQYQQPHQQQYQQQMGTTGTCYQQNMGTGYGTSPMGTQQGMGSMYGSTSGLATFSQEIMALHQMLTRNINFVKFTPLREGRLDGGITQYQNALSSYMFMWKTTEGFYCGTLQPYGMFICIQGQNIYAINTRSQQPLTASVVTFGNNIPGLYFDQALFVGDSFIYYQPNIDQVYSANGINISRLLTAQPQQQQMQLPIAQWFIFSLSQ